MTTASLVLYKTPRSQIEALLSSVLPSCVEKLIIVDNSPDDRWRELRVARKKSATYTTRISATVAHTIWRCALRLR